MKLSIVCPSFFDIPSFLRVRTELRAHSKISQQFELSFVLIDDSGGQDAEVSEVKKLSDVLVIAPPYNLGHQGALVYGLRTLSSTISNDDFIVTMDADGEDKTADVVELLGPLLKQQSSIHQISVARRTHRTETVFFKLFYICFKLVFRIATGTVIRNGNFAAYRGWLLKEVIFHPHFDQCYSSSFISLPLQITFIPLARGQRYFGKSKMGYMGLVTHGIRMFMPFSEKIATRGMIGSGILLFVAVGFGSASYGLNFGSNHLMASGFLALFGTLLMAVFALLFATFSQTKARSLRGLHEKNLSDFRS